MSAVTAHTVRVQRLYRQSLKCLLNWCVHRDLFIVESLKLRADFEANRTKNDARVIEKLVSGGEAKLQEFAHPDAYTHPTDYGGTKYMRYVNNSAGYKESVTAIPPYFT
uniref:NADH dehydrogenase [ubiquinone] 1 beta subcomplex subunit 9 n=1 Tax=Coccolithus braarudii TaxID=221442 RepID=A0A7S0Q501_9EUKA|mmetsp:Transcript_35954/g.76769  ORF Transcript_35954/g.76769 Transcript_35954/m.76769 type:complete len:109 (+) Transcript_35954:82-408(+)